MAALFCRVRAGKGKILPARVTSRLSLAATRARQHPGVGTRGSAPGSCYHVTKICLCAPVVTASRPAVEGQTIQLVEDDVLVRASASGRRYSLARWDDRRVRELNPMARPRRASINAAVPWWIRPVARGTSSHIDQYRAWTPSRPQGERGDSPVGAEVPRRGRPKKRMGDRMIQLERHDARILALMAFVAIVLATTPVLASPIEPGAIRVIDGDTIEARGAVFRLVGFDTPEAGNRAQCESERTLAAAASRRLRHLIAGGGLDPGRFTSPAARATGSSSRTPMRPR
jgi:hypothetical protein